MLLHYNLESSSYISDYVLKEACESHNQIETFPSYSINVRGLLLFLTNKDEMILLSKIGIPVRASPFTDFKD